MAYFSIYNLWIIFGVSICFNNLRQIMKSNTNISIFKTNVCKWTVSIHSHFFIAVLCVWYLLAIRLNKYKSSTLSHFTNWTVLNQLPHVLKWKAWMCYISKASTSKWLSGIKCWVRSREKPRCVRVCIFTSGGPYSSYEDRGDSHDQAAEGGEEGKDLGVGSWRGRKNPLKIDLPGNPPQHLETETP